MELNKDLTNKLTLKQSNFKTIKPNSHILTIQKIWHQKLKFGTTIKLINNYLQLGLTKNSIKNKHFNNIVLFLRQKKTITETKLCIDRINNLIIILYGKEKFNIPNFNIRIFLAGYMITYYTTHVFENMGTSEQQLFDITNILIETFDNICILIKSGRPFKDIPESLIKNYVESLDNFLKTFKEWKQIDQVKLITRIKHALIALYTAYKDISNDDSPDLDLKNQFCTEIINLRSKFKNIANDALQQFDIEQNINSPDIFQELIKVNNNSNEKINISSSSKIINEQLAHELLLNPSFQLDENNICCNINPIYKKISDIFHKSFWNSLNDDLNLSKPCYTKVIRIIKEIYDSIVDISHFSNNKETLNNIKTIDIEHITKEIESDNYNWDNNIQLFNFIITIILKLQCQHRNEETKIKWNDILLSIHSSKQEDKSKIICQALKLFLDLINTIRIDYANKRLQLIAPVIKIHGVNYEKSKFQDKLDKGTITIERTYNWINNILQKEISSNNIDITSVIEDNTKTFIHIHTTAFMSLITDFTQINKENCPETLLYDVPHISSIQTIFKEIVIISIIFITCAQVLNNTKIIKDVQTFEKIVELFSYDLNFNIDEVIIKINNLLLTDSSLNEINRNVLINNLNNHIKPTNKIYQLLHQRMCTFWFKFVITGQPTNMLFINSIKSLIPLIKKSICKIQKLINLNRAVHGILYKKILNDAVLLIK